MAAAYREVSRLRRNDQEQEALALAEHLLAQSPELRTNSFFMIEMGYCYLFCNRLAEAKAMFLPYVDLANNTFFSAIKGLAEIAIREPDFEQAIKYSKLVIEDAPNDSSSYGYLARVALIAPDQAARDACLNEALSGLFEKCGPTKGTFKKLRQIIKSLPESEQPPLIQRYERTIALAESMGLLSGATLTKLQYGLKDQKANKVERALGVAPRIYEGTLQPVNRDAARTLWSGKKI